MALQTDGKLSVEKKAGKLANLEAALAEHPLPAATTGIGPTRWATHGGWRLAYDPDTGRKTWTSPLGRTYTKGTDPPLQ